jgi:hypothetical protein
MPFYPSDWGQQLFLFDDPSVLGPRRARSVFAVDTFILPVSFNVLNFDAALLVTWDVIADPLQFNILPVSWISLQQPPPLAIRWIILPGDVPGGDNRPTGTPSPIQTAFDDDIHQPVATASAP